MDSKFTDKRVLITGASRGLGLVCAKEFASRGARLVLSGRDSKSLENLRVVLHNPDQHMVFAGNLQFPETIAQLIDKSRAFMGDFDNVVHVAGGGFGFRDPLLSWEQFDALYKVNLGAAAEINRLVLPDMIKKNHGFVVHICSRASQEAIGSVGYNTVKAGLAAYVRSLGREVAGAGVVVTGVLAGVFYAPGNSWERLRQTKPEVVERYIEENLPRKYICDAKELIPLIMFLSSDKSSMMSGSCVPIDAGESKAYTFE
jgi:NAD(P)-dependent dehydrogenase (short-subunit alcohol dehydrogenase family)